MLIVCVRCFFVILLFVLSFYSCLACGALSAFCDFSSLMVVSLISWDMFVLFRVYDFVVLVLGTPFSLLSP